MAQRTTKEILDCQAELHRRLESGLDVIDFKELREPTGLGTERPTEPPEQRAIKV